MSVEVYKGVIKEVSEECGYNVSGGSKTFTIELPTLHSVGFKISENESSYLHVHQLQKINGGLILDWSCAVYSLRCYSDVVRFCTIVINSSEMYAKRKD